MANDKRSIHPNALPNYQNAVILREKLEGYALNPTHEAAYPSVSSGKNKAKVFKSALGFDQSNWELLEQRIRDELPYCEAVLLEEDQHGKRYSVTLPITGLNGRTVDVKTGWIVKMGTVYPFLVTAYVVGD